MVKRIGMMLFFMVAAAPHLAGQGLAFAQQQQQGQLQENGQPCPPECVTDSMEIITWFPAPYGLYGELNSMKLAIGDIDGDGDVSEGDIPPADGQIYVDRGVIFKPIAPENVDNDNINNMIHPAYDFTQKARQGEMVYTTDDKFYHYNGSSWVSQTGSGSNAIIFFSCLWRYDAGEGSKGNGEATNWGCQPQLCPSGWSPVGDIYNDQVSVACSGVGGCNWNTNDHDHHPVSAGRSVRLCVSQ